MLQSVVIEDQGLLETAQAEPAVQSPARKGPAFNQSPVVKPESSGVDLRENLVPEKSPKPGLSEEECVQ